MKIITSLFILLITNQFVDAQSTAKTIDSICQAISNRNPEVGMSIGLIDNGKEYFFNYGTLDKESKSAVTENTIYEIGSVTKLLTANLIAQANNEGKLKIDDFIDDYLPKEYVLSKEIKGKLKISDLASHQSGLPDLDFNKLIEQNPKQALDINKEMILSIINGNTTLIDYGNYRYSNINFILLGIILEKVYGKDFENLVKEKILYPVKMENTLTRNFNVKNKVVGSDFKGVKQDFFIWNSLTAPAGLLKSNATDMTKFLKTILSNKGEISNATQIAEKTFYKNTEKEIGFGQQMERSADDVFYYKTGNTMACSAILAYDKVSNWGIIILLNQNNSKLIGELINENYEQVLKRKFLSKTTAKK